MLSSHALSTHKTVAVIVQTPVSQNYMSLYPAQICGFSAWWCFCMWHFSPWLHEWLQGEKRVTSGIIHWLDWLPRIHADLIYAGCKSGPINHSRRCKLYGGLLLSPHKQHLCSTSAWWEESRIPFPNFIPTTGMPCTSSRPTQSRFSVQDPHGRNSHRDISFQELMGCSGFCLRFHESSWAGSQAAVAVTGKTRRLPTCHRTGNTVAFDSNSHF